MPVIELPLTSDGERKFTTEIAGVSYLFRTTYVMGQQNHWVWTYLTQMRTRWFTESTS